MTIENQVRNPYETDALRSEIEQLKKHNAIAAEVVPALMEVNRELITALTDLLDCSIPTGQDTRTDRAMAKAKAVIRKATQ